MRRQHHRGGSSGPGRRSSGGADTTIEREVDVRAFVEASGPRPGADLASLLALQRDAGNRAVTRLVLQRTAATSSTAAPGGPLAPGAGPSRATDPKIEAALGVAPSLGAEVTTLEPLPAGRPSLGHLVSTLSALGGHGARALTRLGSAGATTSATMLESSLARLQELWAMDSVDLREAIDAGDLGGVRAGIDGSLAALASQAGAIVSGIGIRARTLGVDLAPRPEYRLLELWRDDYQRLVAASRAALAGVNFLRLVYSRPTFIPPFVPVGPVVLGDNVPSPGHMIP